MTAITLEQAIRNAIEVELAAARFYENLAERTTDPASRSFLLELREEELGHARAIETFGKTLTDDPIPQEAAGHCEIVETSPTWWHASDVSYRQALRVALESERGAAVYYAALASSAPSDRVRSFFERLAETEQGHVRKIRALVAG
jgi:rubrerythrin